METIDIKCPECDTFADLGAQSPASFSCKQCGSEFGLKDHLCPFCYSYSSDSIAACQRCGTALSLICDRCGISNWPGYLSCYNCGTSLDRIGQIAARHSPELTTKRLDRQMQESKTLKILEEIRSQKSMQELEAIENMRKTRLYLLQQKQQLRERQLLLFSGFLLILFISVIVIVSILSVAR